MDEMEPMSINYDDNSTIQADTVNDNMDVVNMAIDHWINGSEMTASTAANPLHSIRPFNIGDFGCAHGRNSMTPISSIIEQYRKRNESNEITVLHNDLPQNDFGQLFLELANNPLSYQKQSSNIYSMAVGRSFYKQVFNSNSIDIAIAFNTFHWSSQLTAPHKQSIFHGYTNDDDLKQTWKKDTINDLTNILINRGKELAEGGLLITNLLTNDEDSFKESRQFYADVKEIWECMAKDGLISNQEADNMVYPFRYYSFDDIYKAVENSKVQDLGINIQFIQLRHTVCPYQRNLVNGPEYFAEKLFLGFCAFTEPTWRSNIHGDQDMIWNIYQTRFINHFTKNPSHGCIPNHYYTAVFEKSKKLIEQGSASC